MLSLIRRSAKIVQVVPKRSYQTSKDERLRILFCGADPFSIASLKAIHTESRTNPTIASIDVVTKKDKRTGRGLRFVTAPPIKKVALDLGLPVHQIDTFTGWDPPVNVSDHIDLIVAVSFGLLIPPRILKLSRYGGINVHPSLLPDLRGAAPIQWTIIQGRKDSGVSIQTLHPSKFDEGLILDQTPPLPIPDPHGTTFELERDRLAPIGAEMLVKAIRNKLYLPPYTGIDPKYPVTFAPKMKQTDRIVDFNAMRSEEILNRNRAIPKLFALALQESGNKIRVVFEPCMKLCNSDLPLGLTTVCQQIPPGLPYAYTRSDIMNCSDPLLINTIDGGRLQINRITIAGSATTFAAAAAARAHLFTSTQQYGDQQLFVFENGLTIE